MRKSVIIIGAGGHGKVVADIVRKSGDVVFGFLDDNEEVCRENKSELLGSVDKCLSYDDKYFIIAIGNNKIRKSVAQKYPSLAYYTAIHPNAVIAEGVKVGEGTCVMANAVLNSSSEVGKHCIINTASVVEHDAKIADYVHISPGAVLCGTVKVDELSHIGAGAVVRNNVNICKDVVVGCGGAVVADINISGTYVGVPVKQKQK